MAGWGSGLLCTQPLNISYVWWGRVLMVLPFLVEVDRLQKGPTDCSPWSESLLDKVFVFEEGFFFLQATLK